MEVDQEEPSSNGLTQKKNGGKQLDLASMFKRLVDSKQNYFSSDRPPLSLSLSLSLSLFLSLSFSLSLSLSLSPSLSASYIAMLKNVRLRSCLQTALMELLTKRRSSPMA